ncbi:MAG: alpha/beta hydrolase [Dysgonomonas sp.]|uniref:alpha/beta hydrolase n=1 Tax=Dysgonomonas sp. TaxID=1891233 RepID=UPI0039E3F19F
MEKEYKIEDYLKDPHLTLSTREYLRVLNSGDKPVEALPIADARKVLENAQSSITVDLSGIKEETVNVELSKYSIGINIVRSETSKNSVPAFIFIHGGGWVLGDYPTHKRLVRDIVVTSGYTALFINYSPSPEAKYPVAINEIFEAAKWIFEHGDELKIDKDRLAIVGNSVGGNMSAVTSLKAKEEGLSIIKAQALLWPVTDAAFDWESYKLYGEQRFLTTSLMKWMFDQYTTDPADRDEIYLSPLRASKEQLQGLPPTFIAVAENDILRDQGEEFGIHLDESGVDVTTVRYNGVIHDWGMLNGYATIPQTIAVVNQVAEFLRRYLG